MVRLRFAPSPTGFLHVGGLRTALFSWLYVRQHAGKFIFRLEDTDQKRKVEGAENDLIRMLEWAGIDLDEGPGFGGDFGPYRQSERLDIYQEHVRKLLDDGNAYPCFCSAERLEKLKDDQRAKGDTPRYDGLCRMLQQEESSRRVDSGEQHVVRMKIPEVPETIVLQDLIRGNVSIDTSQTEDQVLLKSDGFPTYHLAVVVDDHLMQITHVVRGEEWLPSFPKHLLLYRYFGWTPPEFAHLPLILNPDRSKLSKRQGDVAVEDFLDQGFLPEALLNFIALLGWSPADDQELFSLTELVKEFSFERVNKSGAVFDRDKFNWMNQQYIQQLELNDLQQRLLPFLDKTPYAGEDTVLLKKAFGILQPRLLTLREIGQRLSIFFDESPQATDPEVFKLLQEETSKQVLSAFIKELESVEKLGEDNLSGLVKNVQLTTNIKGKNLWMPLRYAITLEVQGPDLKLIVDLFGKQKCLRLLRSALEL
ncbi:MAG: glutamate--tRNA ligase [SAR324 cluster bacterium]|nr:glutamate--tRNA ligase [SAR324 cluster bacterium]MBL7035393.1 glutamate--tRNA ligase [SAR324 cluster bacterium]